MPRSRVPPDLMPDGTPAFRMARKMLLAALMRSMEVPEAQRVAFNARLNRTIEPLFGKMTEVHRRHPNRRFSLRAGLDLALALQLQRGFVGERMSAELMLRHRDLLHQMWWRSLVKMDSFTVHVPLDAFVPHGARNSGAEAAIEASDFMIAPAGRRSDRRPLLSVEASLVGDRFVSALLELGVQQSAIADGIEELGTTP